MWVHDDDVFIPIHRRIQINLICHCYSHRSVRRKHSSHYAMHILTTLKTCWTSSELLAKRHRETASLINCSTLGARLARFEKWFQRVSRRKRKIIRENFQINLKYQHLSESGDVKAQPDLHKTVLYLQWLDLFQPSQMKNIQINEADSVDEGSTFLKDMGKLLNATDPR